MSLLDQIQGDFLKLSYRADALHLDYAFSDVSGQAALFVRQHSVELVSVRATSLHNPHLAYLAEHEVENELEKQMPLPLLAPMGTVR